MQWYLLSNGTHYLVKFGGAWVESLEVRSEEQVEIFATEAEARATAFRLRVSPESYLDSLASVTAQPPKGIDL